MHTKFLLESLKVRDRLEDLGVDGKVMLEWILRKLGVKVWNVHLAQDRDWWWPLVNMVINVQVP
jgi:hypothetical protein